MKLTELDPRWYVAEEGGPRVGLTFDCPHCRECRLAVATHSAGTNIDPEPENPRGFAAGEFVWTMTGSDFADLSLSPSVDASGSGHWHGFITNGETR